MTNNIKGQHHLPNAPWWYRYDGGDIYKAESFKANAAKKRRKNKKKDIEDELRDANVD